MSDAAPSRHPRTPADAVPCSLADFIREVMAYDVHPRIIGNWDTCHGYATEWKHRGGKVLGYSHGLGFVAGAREGAAYYFPKPLA